MKTLSSIALLALCAFALDAVFYIGMTKELCRNISNYTPEQQKAMALDASVCAAPFYKQF